MGDIVAHVRVIDCALCFGFPSVERLFIVRKNSDDVQVIHILENVFRWINQLSAEYQMKSLLHKSVLL
jgi:hypothetical protein